MLGFTELPSEPDIHLSAYPALRFSLGFLAKYGQQYVWVLYYVLLSNRKPSENLLAFAL